MCEISGEICVKATQNPLKPPIFALITQGTVCYTTHNSLGNKGF